MRTALALRTSMATAALAGAMLVPAAGSAFAAAPTTATSAAAGANTQAPVLNVTSGGGTEEEVTAICVSGPKRVSLGAGTRAELWTTVDGPKVDLYTSGEEGVWKVLDRKNPAWSKNVQIINPSGAEPVLRWQLQGGTVKPTTTSFPALQPGCLRNYELVEDKATPPPAPKPTTSAPAKPKPKPKPQTVVVPKGPVAAGAELGTETTEGAGAPIAVAGAGVLSAGLLLGAAFAVRARRARSRG
ncbi:hypothetical protein ACFVX6_18360 [Streptomyces sp. NPDC058289]|uniref:hypothetical protein n=1 Tax=Streptomyces sp. NPDC058289 TaxID=3346425 RepID=UPI0036E57150